MTVSHTTCPELFHLNVWGGAPQRYCPPHGLNSRPSPFHHSFPQSPSRWEARVLLPRHIALPHPCDRSARKVVLWPRDQTQFLSPTRAAQPRLLPSPPAPSPAPLQACTSGHCREDDRPRD